MKGTPPPSPPKSPLLAAQPRSRTPSPTPLVGAEAAFFRSSPPPETGLEARMAAVAVSTPIVMGQVEGKHQDPDICAHQCLDGIQTILVMIESCNGEELKNLLRDLLTGGSILMLIIAALEYIVEHVDEGKLPKGLIVSTACILTTVLFGVSFGKWGEHGLYIQSQLDIDNLADEVRKLKEVLERALGVAMAFNQSNVFLETD